MKAYLKEYKNRPDVRARGREKEKRWLQSFHNRLVRRLATIRVASRKAGYACKMTVAELEDAWIGECFVCKQPESDSRALSIDHCHKTGRFRGWLCGGCNTSIGHAKDDPALLRQLADYLEARAEFLSLCQR